MASLCSFMRINRSERTTVVLNNMDEIDCDQTVHVTSIRNDKKYLNVFMKLVKHFRRKFKRNVYDQNFRDANSKDGLISSSGCLSFHVKNSRRKIQSFERLYMNCGGRLSSAGDGKARRSIVKNAIGLPKKLWRMGSRKNDVIELFSPSSSPLTSLPDDVLEMILTMLPWTSVMAARRVCQKWRCLCGATHFMNMRSVGCFQRPCLLLFGITRSGFNVGEIHALDVSLDGWYSNTCNELKDRSLYSVASIGADVYIVGGCASFAGSSTSLERSSNKTLKDVLVFSPIKGSIHKAASMKEARAEPILGVFELTLSLNIFIGKTQRHDGELNCVLHEKDPNIKLTSLTKERNGRPRFALISVGGRGSWDEPLDTAEIYDPSTNRWIEIARLPAAFGPVCSGTICNYMLYVYSETDKLAAFDLAKGCWMMVQVSCPLRLPDYSPKLLFCRDRLFMLCVSWCEQNGLLSRRPKAVRKMWELDLNSHSWSEVSRHPDAPMDCNASFVADQNMIYGVEMFRIFGQVLDFVTACSVSGSEIKWKRVSRKHAAHEADSSSCITKSMLVMNL